MGNFRLRVGIRFSLFRCCDSVTVGEDPTVNSVATTVAEIFLVAGWVGAAADADADALLALLYLCFGELVVKDFLRR